MNDFPKLPNIGPDTAAQLREAGITDAETLRAIGSRAAWLRLQENDPSACYMRLCGLEGAIRGVRWHDLEDEVKADLKLFYQAHKLT